jgi:hypothetical protein
MSTNWPPSHIVARPKDKRALCGEKEPLPVTWAEAVQAHIDGHAMALCPKCEALWRG